MRDKPILIKVEVVIYIQSYIQYWQSAACPSWKAALKERGIFLLDLWLMAWGLQRRFFLGFLLSAKRVIEGHVS